MKNIFFKLSIRSYRRRQAMLKAAIRHRLATEDYTCRLPREPKARIRYKLRLQRHPYPWHNIWVYR